MDSLTLQDIKRLAWEAAGKNLYTINVAKVNIGWDHSREETPYMANKLLQEVKRLRTHKLPPPPTVPMRNQYPVKHKTPRITPEQHEATIITPGTKSYDTKSMQQRYQQAHLQWFQSQYPNGYKDGFYLPPKYPKIATSNGITDLVINYLKWMGHFANRTNNIGRTRAKVVPRYNLSSGKVESICVGTVYIKSTSKKGMQDVDANLKHPSHPYGIPWKIEVKCRATRDKPSDQQDTYAAMVKETGAAYSLVRDDVSFFEQYDGLMQV